MVCVSAGVMFVWWGGGGVMGVLMLVTHTRLCVVCVRWGSVVKRGGGGYCVGRVVIDGGRMGWWKLLEDGYGGC